MTTNGKVTLSNVFEISRELKEDFIRIEEKLDKRMCDLEKRVNILEDFKSKTLGIVMVVGAFVGSITSWIWKKIINEN